MLQLSGEYFDHLRRGGTLVVPTRQRAAALSAAYSGATLASGLRVWESPDILSWSAWIDRELDTARARHERIPRRLSTLGSWLLWREAVGAAAEDLDVLAPELLVDSVRRANELLEDWGLELTQASSAESALLVRSRAHYRRRCEELGAIDGGSWRACRAWLHPSARLWLAGFGTALGSARARWLGDHGAVIDAGSASSASGPLHRASLVQLPDAACEAEAVAAWCAGRLMRDPGARLLLVVPRLREQRHLWQQALASSLDAGSILHREQLGASSLFALELGEPLGSHPLVAAAINAITIAAGQAEFEQWSLLLRSPFFASLPRRACLRLELWQRERNIDSGRLPELVRLLPMIGSELGDETAAPLRALLEVLIAADTPLEQGGGRASRDHWARTLASLLGRLGWSVAAPMDEPGLRAKQQFEVLLGEFAAAEPLDQRLSLIETAALLQRLAARTGVEMASEVPVTLTSSIDDPIIRYDGVWAAGLCAADWPQAARPDALLPLPLQLQAGLPAASASSQLQRARAAQQQWLRASAACVLSCSQSEGDLPQEPSPLLIESGAPDPLLQSQLAATRASLEHRLAALAPALHSFRDVSGPRWPEGRALRSGAKLLELQSLCPFRAFGELRLEARPLTVPSPGIEPHQRGRIVHRALELFWTATAELATLLARADRENHVLALQCAERAIHEIAAVLPRSLQSVLLARECERTAELIDQLIAWERTRAPFATQELESTRTLEAAGTTLRLRLDRVDRLQDGRLVLMDYKSGRARSFDPFEARPQQPQLPTYATVLGERVAAVLAVYLSGDGVQLKGFADRPDRLQGLTAAATDESQWQALQRRWGTLVRSLVQEFVDGYAPVAPQPGVCDRCHLQVLCRIAPELLTTEEHANSAEDLSAEASDS